MVGPYAKDAVLAIACQALRRPSSFSFVSFVSLSLQLRFAVFYRLVSNFAICELDWIALVERMRSEDGRLHVQGEC